MLDGATKITMNVAVDVLESMVGQFEKWAVDPVPSDDKVIEGLILTDQEKRYYSIFKAYEFEGMKSEAAILERQRTADGSGYLTFQEFMGQAEREFCLQAHPSEIGNELRRGYFLSSSSALFENAFWLSVYSRIPVEWAYSRKKLVIYKTGQIAARVLRTKVSDDVKSMLE